ncbi:MAG: DUF2958 domain-containing protein [Sideroxydans sp.]|nr:DUF2958 domain-containing protein [Sideroxydans sp.]
MAIEINSDNSTNKTAGRCPAPWSSTVPVDLNGEEKREAEKQKQIIYGALLNRLNGFIGSEQMGAMREVLRGSEARYMQSTITGMLDIIETMPKTYQTDRQDDPVVYLHYFKGGCDWYITELDFEAEQLQAFGKADLGMGFPELGYISIVELLECGVELDLHWPVRKLSEI